MYYNSCTNKKKAKQNLLVDNNSAKSVLLNGSNRECKKMEINNKN